MVAAISSLLGGLVQNIVAGCRLALFLPVKQADFRISAADYALLAAAGLVFWFAGGMVREGISGGMDTAALAAALAQSPVILAVSLLVSATLGSPSLLCAFAVLFTATDPLFELAATAINLFMRYGPAEYAGVANWATILWALAVLLRTQWVLTRWRSWRSIAAGVLVVAMLLVMVWVVPRNEAWFPVEEQSDADAMPSVVREDLFHLQGRLLEDRIATLEPERPGVEDLYFLGVAPYALQDTFVHELQVVKGLMDERFDTAGRSIALVNHTSTLAELPIASASNLRMAIERLANRINVEEDVLFLFISTHGNAESELAFELPPLALQQLSPTALARMLNDAGIRWKVVVISACYSGGFVEPLRDDNTLIITASDASHSSFGCEAESAITWFGQAYFNEGLRQTLSFSEAFAQAKAAIAARERAQGLEASNPQMYLGKAMAAKLASVERRLRERARRDSVQASLGTRLDSPRAAGR